MAKRDFRPAAAASKNPPAIPTLDDFDANRRAFLARLGAALGIGALGSVLSACGERTVNYGDDYYSNDTRGAAPMMPTRADGGVDSDMGGTTPAMPTRADATPQMRDTAGVAPMPDARVDPDWGLSGGAPAPDARADPDWGMAGVAPAADARGDADECPNL